jgi:hypothetical protein
MPDERPRPDIDQVREALREHDEAHEHEPAEERPEDDGGDEPADDD